MTPFEVLGLPAGASVTDDDVRSAWRRVAAATHPDRADGGDPEAFAAAAAAYTALRTSSARGEVLSDLREAAGQACRVVPVPVRGRSGLRIGRLTTRLALAAGVSVLAVTGAGWQPATIAVIIGTLTWLCRTSRGDLRR